MRPNRPLPPIVRPVLAALALTELAVGGWQLFAPHSFYRFFPTGQGWVERVGAYDQHLITDVGGLTLALAFMLALAAFFFERRLVQVALGAYLVQAVPHLVYHVVHRDHMSVADNVANIGILAGAVVLPAALLAMTVLHGGAVAAGLGHPRAQGGGRRLEHG